VGLRSDSGSSRSRCCGRVRDGDSRGRGAVASMRGRGLYHSQFLAADMLI
jgi:hypothetical protein